MDHLAYISEEVSNKFGLDTFKKGWFTETGTTDGDEAFSIEVENILFQGKSKYQDILVFDSKRFGRTLVLDNCIQCTEADEFSYQEMITFLPLNSHPDPKKVLVIGGGDGGVVREVVKHPSVESVTLCEIDEMVIDVSKQFLPFMNTGFRSPKLKVHLGDGAEFLMNHEDEFDVVITDSSDPKGPAVSLFLKPFYESLHAALKPGGIICSQGLTVWFDLHILKQMVKFCKTMFPMVAYASTFVPAFPSGQVGFLMCSKASETDFRRPLRKFSTETLQQLGLRYYTSEVHRSAFALPFFVAKELGLKWQITEDTL